MWGNIQCGFWFCISLISDGEYIFMYLLAIYIFLLEKNIYSGLQLTLKIKLFVFLILSWISCLYVLDINSLLVVSANIFCHSIRCLFVLLMFSFAVQKLLCLIGFHLFVVSFASFALGDRPKTYYYDTSQSVLPMFSSRRLWLLIFEFIFVYVFLYTF